MRTAKRRPPGVGASGRVWCVDRRRTVPPCTQGGTARTSVFTKSQGGFQQRGVGFGGSRRSG